MRQTTLPGTRGGWPAELSAAYERDTGGFLHPARIGKALAPVLRRLEARRPENPWGYGPKDLLRYAFGCWMRSEKRKYGPEYLAREFAEFVRGPGI